MSKENESFTKLLLSHQKHIYGYIFMHIPNDSDAEDIFQDVALVMCRRFEEFSPGSNFLAWGIEIAKRKVIKFRQKQVKSKVIFNDQNLEKLIEYSTSYLDGMDHRKSALKKCIDKLSPQDKILLEKRYHKNVKVIDISKQVNRSAGALYQVFSRIHLTLRNCVKRTMQKDGINIT